MACSGGSDSLALLHLTASWAKARDRALLVLTVDHGLRPEAAAETRSVAEIAAQLGAACEILHWTSAKPQTGLQAAARQARHRLLAEACQAVGARDLLLGHTLDDQAETVWMRLQAGGNWRSLTGMAPVSRSPVWPEGRDVRLLRPLLDTRRETLQAWLRERGQAWVEDPSNQDTAYTRIRIRQRLGALEAGGFDPSRLAALGGDLQDIQQAEDLSAALLARRTVSLTAWGGAQLDRAAFQAAAPAVRYRVWEALVLALSGVPGLPDRRALARLDAQLAQKGRVTAAGTLLDVSDKAVWLVRDPGAVLGRVDHAAGDRLSGPVHAPVWDGRFALQAVPSSVTPGVLGKDYAGLEDRACLDGIPGFARSGLLCLRREGRVIGLAGVPSAGDEGGNIRPLFLHRFCTRLLPAQPPVWFDTSESLQPVLQ
nr:tRNA lysidine(34) synthetase TilS [Maricaulis parjimensis]